MSILALGVDMGVFLLTLLAISPVVAAVTGYSAGMAAHWALSTRVVFTPATERSPRRRQAVLFVVSGLAGVAITAGIMQACGLLGIDPIAAKAVAVTASFASVYVLRAAVVFRREQDHGRS